MSKRQKGDFLFNFISPVYGLFYNSQKEKYQESLNIAKAKFDFSQFETIIDVGCGTGALCSVLNQLDLKVTGVDPAKRMLKIGEKKKENEKVNFVLGGTSTKLPFEDNSFDVSIASYVAHGLKKAERLKLYAEMSRISKKYVILYDYNDKRGFFTSIIEWAERGDYFNFIKTVKDELDEHFKSFEMIDVDVRASLYICKVK